MYNEQVQVDFYKPERRFGWAVLVHSQNLNGQHLVLHVDAETGREEWKPVEPNQDAHPTFFLDDVVLNKIVEGWQKIKSPPPPPATQDAIALLREHRDDAVRVRDVLLDLVAKPRLQLPGDAAL